MSAVIDSAGGASTRAVGAVLLVLDTAREYGYTITRTTLAKLLYFADLEAVEQGGDPVSDIEWRWLYHGPYNNVLRRVEDELVGRGQISSEQYFDTGRRLRLVPNLHDYPYVEVLGSEDVQIIRQVVRKLGGYAAVTIRDLSYKTAPMVDAQARGRESVINLDLARPVPKFRAAAARARAVIARLPAQEDDPEAQDEVAAELEELAQSRAIATARLLGDD